MPSSRILSLAVLAGVAASPSLAPAAPSPPPGAISAQDLAFLNRVTWGANQADAETLARMGRGRWLARQLQAGADDPLPPAAQAQVDALPIGHISLKDQTLALEAQSKAANQLTDPDQKKAAQQAYQQAMNDLSRQAATRDLLRDLYSPDQVREQMTWFWFNHFNVHAGKANIRAMVGDYEDHAIRPHALGRFRDLLEATLRHPAMLRYLDNADNAAGHINENYARELLELHTMGVGSGYSQKDVQELARILTGVGIDPKAEDPKLRPQLQDQLVRNGLFEFNPNRHDYGDKVLLGHTIKGRGLAEVDEALDIIARQPATARHVSGQIASYFMGDTPPPALVGRMTETFQHSDGDIARVLATLFQSPEFNASLGSAFKDPTHYAVSAVRLAYNDRVILNAQPIQGWLNRMAEGLYNHETPDGYPVAAAAWDGPGQMAMRFEIARQIGAGAAGLFKPDTPGATEAPAFPQIENALYFNAIAPTMGPKSLTALNQAISPQDWNTLFLSSPEFMRR